jgi:hypothetical protein
MLLVSETHGEVSKLSKLPLLPKLLLKKLVHSELLLKENSTSELLVKMLLDGGIMKPRLSLLLLQVITVKFLLLLSPYLVQSKNVMLLVKKLSNPSFVLVLKLLVPPLMVLLINTVDTVVLLVLFQPLVLEEDFLLLPLMPLRMPLLMPLRLLPNQPLLKFQFMSNHLLPLLPLKLQPVLLLLLQLTKSPLPLTPDLSKTNIPLLLPLQPLPLLPKK